MPERSDVMVLATNAVRLTVTYADLFTPRQLIALTTFSDLVQEARGRVQRDAAAAGLADQPQTPAETAARARPRMPTLSGCIWGWQSVVSRIGTTPSVLGTHGPSGTRASTGGSARTASLRNLFARQAIPMAWDYGEANPFSDSGGGFSSAFGWIRAGNPLPHGVASPEPPSPATLHRRRLAGGKSPLPTRPTTTTSDTLISPTFSTSGYVVPSGLSFRLSLRRSPCPNRRNWVATPYRRHGGKEAAEVFFLDGMTRAMERLAEQTHPGSPITIYYAFKQSERKGDAGTSSTGWETFLDAVIRAGLAN